MALVSVGVSLCRAVSTRTRKCMRASPIGLARNFSGCGPVFTSNTEQQSLERTKMKRLQTVEPMRGLSRKSQNAVLEEIWSKIGEEDVVGEEVDENEVGDRDEIEELAFGL